VCDAFGGSGRPHRQLDPAHGDPGSPWRRRVLLVDALAQAVSRLSAAPTAWTEHDLSRPKAIPRTARLIGQKASGAVGSYGFPSYRELILRMGHQRQDVTSVGATPRRVRRDRSS
jgi:hypothetical protein